MFCFRSNSKYIIKAKHWLKCSIHLQCIGCMMDSVLLPKWVGRGFEHRSGQLKIISLLFAVSSLNMMLLGGRAWLVGLESSGSPCLPVECCVSERLTTTLAGWANQSTKEIFLFNYLSLWTIQTFADRASLIINLVPIHTHQCAVKDTRTHNDASSWWSWRHHWWYCSTYMNSCNINVDKNISTHHVLLERSYWTKGSS